MKRLAILLLVLACGNANAAAVYSVSFDTTGFDPAGNPYQLDVNLISQNGGDLSTVTLDNFSCSGCPGVAQTLSASVFSQDLFINFTAGGPVSFDLSLTPDLTFLGSLGPDSMQVSILDQASNPITTTDPFDALLFASLDSAAPALNSFGSPANSSPAFAAPLVSVVVAAPEPHSILLTLAAAMLCLALRRRSCDSTPAGEGLRERIRAAVPGLKP